MPRFAPFAGVRYDLDRVRLADVLSPPYDVVDADAQARLEARSPHNAIHLELSRDEPERDRYEAARCRLEEWMGTGVLVADPEPAFYVYRMGYTDDDGRPRQTTGVLGALELDPGRRGDVLPHERTMGRPLDDRLRLLRACRANLSPIWTLSLAPGLSAACEPAGPPLARATDTDGVHHRLWRVTAPAVLEAVAGTVASAPAVIADGHHRYETALAYQRECRAANGDQPGDHDLVLAYMVELADEQLSVRAIHRLVWGLPEGFPLVEVLARHFDVGPPRPVDGWRPGPATLGVVTDGAAHELRPLPVAGDGERADSELVEDALAGLPAHQVGHHHSREETVARVVKGEAQAAFLLRPVTVARLTAVARAGERLPEKTTFFRPKPVTGLAFRRLRS